MGFDYSGFVELRDHIVKMESGFETFLKQFLLKQALDVAGKAKLRTPTDTGLLKNSWAVGDEVFAYKGRKLKSGKNKGKLRYSRIDSAWTKAATIDSITKKGDELIIYIVNNVEYAGFVEYGHLDRSRKKWIPGKFMCTLAIKDVQAKMPTRFNKDFAIWVKTL